MNRLADGQTGTHFSRLARILIPAIAAMLAIPTGWWMSAGETVGAAPSFQRYIVVFEPGANAQSVAAGLAGPEDRVERTLARVFSGAIVEMNPQRAAAWAEHPNVSFIEPEEKIALSSPAPQWSPQLQTQSLAPWGLDRIDQKALPLNGRYTYSTGASGVQAYVVDTGVMASHPELAGRVSAGYSVVTDGRGTSDCNGHGTHIAGTIGGSTHGVAKQITVVPVRVVDCNGWGTSSGLIGGLEWILGRHVAGQPAVVNISLAGAGSAAIDAAVNSVIAAGISVVTAAGNDGADACGVSPARVPGALTVGASTITDLRLSSSNVGSCVDLFAPGHAVPAAWSDGGIRSASGTSVAAPHVAGAVALAMVSTGVTDPATIRQAILSAASLNQLSDIGNGSPNRLVNVEPFALAPQSSPITPQPAQPQPAQPQPAQPQPIDPAIGGVMVPAPSVVGGSTEVAVTLSQGIMRVRFAGLSGPGQMQVAERSGIPVGGGAGVVLPSGYVDLGFSGSSYSRVEVCLPGIAGSRLLHFPAAGGREDLTARTEASENLICGAATRLASFATGTLATERIAGADRYATAVAVSQFGSGELPTSSSRIVFVTTGENPADALAAGAAAAARGAVVLLARRDSLPVVTRAELQRRQPTQIYVVGGTSAISAGVLTEVRAAVPGASVTRVFGASRYETAVELSQLSHPSGAEVVYVATGIGYADALAGSAAAGRDGGPMILVPGTSAVLPAAVTAELARLAPREVVVLGGSSAVRPEVVAAIQGAVAGVSIQRIAGADRYATAAAISADAGPYCTRLTAGKKIAFVATGFSYADALAAAAVAGASGCPLLITRPTEVPAAIASALSVIQPNRISVLGGSTAITPQTELVLASYLPV
jgi:subtilisin family serine protease/putative cell wall-binding protein